jgi:hypothetical protein
VEYELLYERSGGVRLAGFTDVDWAGCRGQKEHFRVFLQHWIGLSYPGSVGIRDQWH